MAIHSGFVLSRADGRPMYLQIMEQIKERIATGDWKPGQEIPSIRQLAAAVQVSVITIKRTYLELEREGVIETQHGKGSFVAAQPKVGARRRDDDLARHLDEAVRLAALMGLDAHDLMERLSEAARRLEKEQS